VTTQSDAATHGTGYEYDQRVPLVLYGRSFRPGRYSGPVTPADLAPTLGAVLGVGLPTAEGRVLTEALAEPRASAASSSPTPH
jgi:hypothetical protein